MTRQVAAIAALVPLAIAPGLYLYYDVSPKLVMLLAGTSLVLPWTDSRARSLFTFVNSAPGRVLAALLAGSAAALALSTLLSENPSLSFTGSVWRRLGLLAYVSLHLFALMAAAAVAENKRRLMVVLRAVAGGGGIIAIYGILQYFGIDPLIDPARYVIGEGERAIVRPPATLGYANYAASYLLFVFFAGVGIARADDSATWRRLGCAIMLLSAVAIVVSGTRGALAGLAAGGLLLVAGRPRRFGQFRLGRRSHPPSIDISVDAPNKSAHATSSPNTPSVHHGGARSPACRVDTPGDTGRPRTGGQSGLTAHSRAIVLALIAGAVAGAFVLSPAGERIRARILWSIEEPLGGARRWLWADTLTLIGDRPFTGWGLETFTSVFPAYQSAALAAAYPDFYHESPHNLLLDTLAGSGIPSLLLLVGLCVLGFRWAQQSEAQGFSRALAAGLLALLTSHQFIVLIVPTALAVLLTLAMLAALAPRSPNAEPGRVPVLATRLAAGTIAVALALAAVQVHRVEAHLATANRLLDREDVRGAGAAYDAAMKIGMPGTAADLWFSRRLLFIALSSKSPPVRTVAFRKGFEAGRRATETAEDAANAWYNLAMYTAALEQREATEENLGKAIAASPNWFKPHWALAQALLLRERYDEAEREAQLAADLAGGKHPEVAATLEKIREARAGGA